MIFADTLQTYRERLNGDQSLKERSNAYREQRITALLKSWSDLNQMDVAQISKTDGLAWPRDSGKPRVRRLSTIPLEHSNWFWTSRSKLARALRQPCHPHQTEKIRLKQLQPPSQKQFVELINTIRNGDGGWAERCADLVECLAYSDAEKVKQRALLVGTVILKKVRSQFLAILPPAQRIGNSPRPYDS
jgi:hypothetical protein